jgi:hypothetical protein
MEDEKIYLSRFHVLHALGTLDVTRVQSIDVQTAWCFMWGRYLCVTVAKEFGIVYVSLTSSGGSCALIAYL